MENKNTSKDPKIFSKTLFIRFHRFTAQIEQSRKSTRVNEPVVGLVRVPLGGILFQHATDEVLRSHAHIRPVDNSINQKHAVDTLKPQAFCRSTYLTSGSLNTQ